MPAKDLGTKHLCFKCGAKFYDMRKPDAVCPRCGADQRESPANRPPETRRSRLSAVKVIESIAPVKAASDDDDDDSDDEEVVAADDDES